jgi:hypothetical protein
MRQSRLFLVALADFDLSEYLCRRRSACRLDAWPRQVPTGPRHPSQITRLADFISISCAKDRSRMTCAVVA